MELDTLLRQLMLLNTPQVPKACTLKSCYRCWSLDSLIAFNQALAHINAELSETVAGGLTLTVGPASRHTGYAPIQGKALCTLVERHHCLTGFKFINTDSTLLARILSLLSGRTNVKCLSVQCREPPYKGLLHDIQDIVRMPIPLKAFQLSVDDISDSAAAELGMLLSSRPLTELRLGGEACMILRYISNPLLQNRMIASDKENSSILPKLTNVYLQFSEYNLGPHISISEFFPTNTSVTHLEIFSWNNMSDDVISVLPNALKANTTLRKLSISTVFGKAGAAALGEMLRVNNGLTHLNLNYALGWERADGEEIYEHLAPGVQFTKSLRVLKASYCWRTLGGFSVLAESLSKNQSGLVIVLNEGYYRDRGSINIAKIIVERKLSRRITFNWVARYGVSEEDFFKYNHLIIKVSFGLIGPPSMSLNEMCTFWKGNDIVEDLQCCITTSKDCCQLTDYLATTRTLQYLTLLIFECDPEELSALLAALEGNTSIDTLCLYAEVKPEAASLAKMLRNNRSLKNVRLDFSMTEAALRLLTDGLKRNYTVSYLCSNVYSLSALLPLHEILKRNATLLESALLFVQERSLCKRWAAAFDLLCQSEGFKREVAHKKEIPPNSAELLIRQKRKFLERNFFIVSGIVQDSIVCRKTGLGAPQLSDLDEFCITQIASYLRLRDIKSDHVRIRYYSSLID